jgi:hypothetical protein
MSKRFMLLMIFINLVLDAVYVFSSIHMWEEMNNWYDYNMQSTWTAFYVYPHRISGLPTVLMPVQKMLNLPFIVFLVMIITNIALLTAYFVVIPLLQRWANKEI